MKNKYLIGFFISSIAMSTLSYAVDGEIKIKIGQTGYVGEIIPITKASSTTPHRFTQSSSTNYYSSVGLLSLTNRPYWCGSTDGLQKIPELNRWGFKLINTKDPSSGYLLLAINGSIGGQYKVKGTGAIINIRGTLNRSYLSGSNLDNVTDNGTFCWGPSTHDLKDYYSMDFYNFVSLKITSYSVYAYGNIKPGQFSLVTNFVLSRNSANSLDDNYATFLNPGEIKVTALRSCNVTSGSNTNIKFQDQLSSTFSSPKLLDSSPISTVNVNCSQSGKNYITLKAYNSLVAGNMSGMLLNGTKTNNTSQVYVVSSLNNITNQTCQANDASAIKYFDGQHIQDIDNKQSFNQNIQFGLCANGKVLPDLYKGAIDVSFIVE